MKQKNESLRADSHYLPSVQECESCEFQNECRQGKYCLSAAEAIKRERRQQRKQRKRPMGYRVVNDEVGMRAAVRVLDPEQTIIVTFSNSCTVKDVVFKTKKEAVMLRNRLNKQPEYQSYGGHWRIAEVHKHVSDKF